MNERKILTTDYIVEIRCRDRKEADSVVEAAKNGLGLNSHVKVKRLIETAPGSNKFSYEYTRERE